MKDSNTIKQKILIIPVFFVLFSLLILSAHLFVFADGASWTDEGKYDPQWLGDYEKTDVYEIKNNEQLAAFLVAAKNGKTFQNKTIKMYADLDMSSCNWSACFSAETPFLGTFDGRGYFIKGLVFDSGDAVSGFMSYNGGTIVNALFSVDSHAPTSSGIAVNNNGKIYNSGVMGNVGAESSVLSGGISAQNNGTIENCYSVAQIKGTTAGAITAKNTGSISSCTWSGSDIGSVDQVNINNCERLDDKQVICNKLNKQTKERGWMNWVLDTKSQFGGNPVLTSKEVVNATIPVKGISLNIRQRTMWTGGTFEIKYTVVPANATNPKVKLYSTNEAVAVVDANGKVKAKGRGFAVIRAQTEDGNKTAECYVTVNPTSKPTGIKLESTHFKIPIGKPIQLKYSITPTGASYWGATFSSGDSNILDCSDSGLIVGLQPGVTIVTATTNDGGKSISALVTVVEDSYSSQWSGNVAESFSGGDGSAENPFVIDNGETLALLAYNVNNGNSYDGVYFRQTDNIMLNDITVDNWYSDLTLIKTWTPIGSSEDRLFKGHYDGGSFAVAGIYIHSESTAGLFGYTNGGSITNLDIRKSYINGGEYTAGIAGYNSSAINSCEIGSDTFISGTNYVGGICGYTTSPINYCKNLAIVEGKDHVGGICGSSNNIITNCQNRSTVKGSNRVGGICGSASMPIENSLNSAVIYGNKMIGGICGYSDMTVVNSFSLVTPEAAELYGAICGFAQKDISSYVIEDQTACGNRDNDDRFHVNRQQDGTLLCLDGGSLLADALNLFNGCIYSDSYLTWDTVDGSGIQLSYSSIEFSRIINEEMGFELSGEGFSSDLGLECLSPEDNDIEQSLSKINHSIVFEKTALVIDDILFSLLMNKGDDVPDHYIFSFPLDFSKTSLSISSPDHQSFAHIALININDGDVFVYIPELVSKTREDTFVGIMKCISHSVNEGTVINNGEGKNKPTFLYSDNKITMSSDSYGIWFVADLGENEFVMPIETGNIQPDITDPQDKHQLIDFKRALPIITIIVIIVASAAVIVLRRRKNVSAVNSNTKQNNESFDE